MTSTAGGAFGFDSGLIIQEFGYDDDVDEALRRAAEAETGTGLVDEDYEDVADSALIWWRHDDGDVDDLTDLLVDAQANLDGDGVLWLLTPKARTTGAVPASDIEEAAGTAGMHARGPARARTRSSVGRAARLHRGGRRFESGRVHHGSLVRRARDPSRWENTRGSRCVTRLS